VSALGRRGIGALIAVTLLVLGVFQGFVVVGVAAPLASHLLHPAVGVVMAGAFVRVLTSGRTSFLEHPALRLAGIVSYGVYLFHWPVLELGLRASGIAPGRVASPVLAVAVVCGLAMVAFVVGTASYVVVERPFLRLARAPSGEVVIDLRDADSVDRRANLGPCPTTAISTTSSARSA
jgi:peptidoglycan/LPS O-acetylase OafA/YrhL